MNDLQNGKYTDYNQPWITFFTPTFNREKTLVRCYEAMKQMIIPRDKDGNDIYFEWLIIDDGSQDNTRDMVGSWLKENKIPLRYIYQPNQGKHVATQKAINESRGTVFTTLDSDDIYIPETIKVFWESWCDIPESKRPLFRGVSCRCKEANTGELMGNPLPRQPYYENTVDMRYRDHIKGELGGFIRLDVLKEYPTPSVPEKLSFYPEAIVQYDMSEKYIDSVIDVPLRIYYRDTNNALTAKTFNKSAENYHLWMYIVNNLFRKYLFKSPKEMLKGIVGMSMDGFRTKRKVRQILRDVKHPLCKVTVACFMPLGYVLSKK